MEAINVKIPAYCQKGKEECTDAEFCARNRKPPVTDSKIEAYFKPDTELMLKFKKENPSYISKTRQMIKCAQTGKYPNACVVLVVKINDDDDNAITIT